MAPDPREEVPGELPAIDETLATMTKLGTAFENAAQGFQKINTAGWEGPTADAFRDYYQQEPPKWFRAADAFTESADALRQYRDVLAWAQRQAEQACADIERADRQTAQAEAKYEQAADQGNATEPFQDPGAAARNQAQAALDAAKEQVEEAAKRAAAALIKASEKAPPQPGPLTMLASGVGDVFQNVAESYGDFWKGSFDGALDMLQQARTLNPFDPYNMMHPQQYGENISQLAASTVAAGKAFISDPIGTGKAMIGAGIDSFTKDPSGFIGRLAPEVAAGLATSGSSTAGSLGRRALGELGDLVKGKPSADLPGGRNPAPVHHQPPGNIPGPTSGHAPPANTPAPRPESMPPSHQPSSNTGTPFERGNHSPTPNHGYNPSPPQPTASNWNNPHTGSDFSESTRDAHREQYTPSQPGEGNTPGTAQHPPPGSWQSPSPADDQPFGPKGSDWEHRDTADTPNTPRNEEQPRQSWGRGRSRWDDDDPDWGDPWEEGHTEPRHHQQPEPPDAGHRQEGDPHDPNHFPEPADQHESHDGKPDGHDGDHSTDHEPSFSDHDDSNRPGLDDLFPEPGGAFDEQRALSLIRSELDGKYGDLNLSVKDVSGREGAFRVFAEITDESGQRVGSTTRDIQQTPDGLSVTHAKTELSPAARGSGFATEFNSKMLDWYEESGVKRIDLQANIDVGSYAWARDGFEFANEAQAVDKIAPRLEHELARAERELGELQATLREPGADTDALRKEIDLREQTLDSAREIMSRFVEGHEKFPTPKEISELGRPDGLLPGESRNLQWMGKNVLTGRDYRTGEYVRWHGVKYL
ncbi:putative T7SS-secreted protein [Saccharopolyspora shandongensis]|uniref:WXG100 family type VII secretion target n=1 Tax=Saccharopolyspora shandongensis TaxID=418495 RepID=UPI003444D651